MPIWSCLKPPAPCGNHGLKGFKSKNPLFDRQGSHFTPLTTTHFTPLNKMSLFRGLLASKYRCLRCTKLHNQCGFEAFSFTSGNYQKKYYLAFTWFCEHDVWQTPVLTQCSHLFTIMFIDVFNQLTLLMHWCKFLPRARRLCSHERIFMIFMST